MIRMSIDVANDILNALDQVGLIEPDFDFVNKIKFLILKSVEKGS